MSQVVLEIQERKSAAVWLPITLMETVSRDSDPQELIARPRGLAIASYMWKPVSSICSVLGPSAENSSLMLAARMHFASILRERILCPSAFRAAASALVDAGLRWGLPWKVRWSSSTPPRRSEVSMFALGVVAIQSETETLLVGKLTSAQSEVNVSVLVVPVCIFLFNL